jgi:uncharacterized protein (DUF2267 family)
MAVEYEEFIEAVSRAGHRDHASARQAVQATVTVLARMRPTSTSPRGSTN